jgi:glycosyltransferase involved in cell wall biosynthesis
VSERGQQVTVMATTDMSMAFTDHRIDVVHAWSLRSSWQHWRRLRDTVDVVHLHSVFRPIHALIATDARRLGLTVVQSLHGGISQMALDRDRVRKRLYRPVERHQLRASNAVVALSPIEAEDVERYAPGLGVRTVVIPNAAPTFVTESSGRAIRARSPRPSVVSLARFDVYHKGLDRLVELAAAVPEADFSVHGQVDKNAPAAFEALKATAPSNLRFLPPVFEEAKLDALAQADAFVLLSRMEGMSIALLEALATGLPCLVSEEVAQTMPPAPSEAMRLASADRASEVSEFLSSTQRLAAGSDQAVSYARQHFALPAVVEKLHRLYEREAVALESRPIQSQRSLRQRAIR